MKLLVTGASGFVGTHLVRHLADAGHQVTGLVRRAGSVTDERAEEVVADLLDDTAVADAIERTNPEGIFHLGAPETSVGASWKHPEETRDQNLRSVLSVLEGAKRLGAPPKILLVSSSEVPGAVEKQPMAEDVPANPANPYAESKHAAEQAALRFRELPIVVVRPFNHIGPGQSDSFAIPNWARQIAGIEVAGESGMVKVGNLDTKRDFTDVRDMVTAYELLMSDGAAGEIYHAGSGKSHSLREILDWLIELSTATIEVVLDSERQRPNDIPEQRSDSTKLRQLGWEPRIELKQTLRDILDEAREKVTKG